MIDSDMVSEKLSFSQKYIPGVVAYELKDHANDDLWKTILLLFNGNNYSIEFVHSGEEDGCSLHKTGRFIRTAWVMLQPGRVRLHPISMMILAEE